MPGTGTTFYPLYHDGAVKLPFDLLYLLARLQNMYVSVGRTLLKLPSTTREAAIENAPAKLS